MTQEQWTRLVELVGQYGPEKLEFELGGDALEFEDIAHMEHEDKVVILLD